MRKPVAESGSCRARWATRWRRGPSRSSTTWMASSGEWGTGRASAARWPTRMASVALETGTAAGRRQRSRICWRATSSRSPRSERPHRGRRPGERPRTGGGALHGAADVRAESQASGDASHLHHDRPRLRQQFPEEDLRATHVAAHVAGRMAELDDPRVGNAGVRRAGDVDGAAAGEGKRVGHAAGSTPVLRQTGDSGTSTR